MKKLIYFFSIAFLLFQSCSSSDNSQNSTLDTSLLFKKWYIVSQTYNGVKSNGYVCSNGNRDYLEFNEPNILNYYHIIGSSNCNYTSDGPYNWIKKGNIISVYFNEKLVSTLTINELTITTFSFITTYAGNGQSALHVYSSY
jgi:hypothetical protein